MESNLPDSQERQETQESRANFNKVRLASEVAKLVLGVGLVLFGVYVCYELLKAIVLLSQGQFVPLVQIITDIGSSSVADLPNTAELPEGIFQVLAVFLYLLLLAVFVSLAKALLSPGIKILSIDNYRAARELWREMRADLKADTTDETLEP